MLVQTRSHRPRLIQRKPPEEGHSRGRGFRAGGSRCPASGTPPISSWVCKRRCRTPRKASRAVPVERNRAGRCQLLPRRSADLVRFAPHSLVEGDGFELSVPRMMGGRFRTKGTGGNRDDPQLAREGLITNGAAVLGRPNRLEPALLKRAGKLHRRHRIIGEEHRAAEMHAVPSLRDAIGIDEFHAVRGALNGIAVRPSSVPPITDDPICLFASEPCGRHSGRRERSAARLPRRLPARSSQ